MTHLGKFILMPPPPGVCQECGYDHAPEMPHNVARLHYKYDFYSKHGRWPTWADAMAHCTDEMKRIWKDELRERGVEL